MTSLTGDSGSRGPTTLGDTTNVAITPVLEAETERLLSHRTRDIRFSPGMDQAYRRKTWPQRGKIARAWMIWVAAISVAFVPISYLLAPDSLWLAGIVSGLLLPALHGCAYLVWRKPRSAVVEGLSLTLLMCSLMIGFGTLAVAAGGNNYERYLTWIVFVNTIAMVVFNVEYFWSLSLMVCSTAIFLGFELFNPAIDFKEAIGTSLYFAIGFFGSSIARKTQTLIGKKAFLMSLRNGYRSAALKEANRQLEILATRDPLTGLANRRSATRFIETIWLDRTIPKASVAFIMADLDSFKPLNDSAGHAAGDLCIQRVAKAIEQSVRSDDDAAFRYGGEEFLIILTNATADIAWTLAERIRHAVEALAIVNPGIQPTAGSAGVMTISLGVAFAQEDAPPELVAKWADDALYDAKRSGRNAVFLSNAHAADDTRAAEAVASSPQDLDGQDLDRQDLDKQDPGKRAENFAGMKA